MPQKLYFFLLSLCALFSFTEQTFAHRVHLFAYIEGTEIVADCRFSKTSPVQHGQVQVISAEDGALLVQGKTDKEGICRLPIPAGILQKPADMRLLLKAGEGHQAEWLVSAHELRAPLGSHIDPGPVTSAGAKSTSITGQEEPLPQTMGDKSPSSPAPLTRLEIEAIVNRSLDAHLKPVMSRLAEEEAKGPTPSEILTGLSFIFALFALIASIKNRPASSRAKSEPSQHDI